MSEGEKKMVVMVVGLEMYGGGRERKGIGRITG
jgi:hypothetical protein